MELQPSRLLAQCPLCQASYEAAEVRLLGTRGTTKLFHCSCKACGHSMLAVILETAGWVGSVGMVTDLKASEAGHFQVVEPVATNEVIQIHELLNRNSQEFCRHLTAAHKA